jgi:4,5-DOPA dioxygenase extradiol
MEQPAPKAILVVSAHWQELRPIRVTAARQPHVVRDVDGFPAWLYTIDYPCPGAPDVAYQAITLLLDAGAPAIADPSRGLDSGVWSPLRIMYPGADIPVAQASMPAPATPAELVELGRLLAPLRDRGVLLVGSGGTVDNPQLLDLDRYDGPVDAWAQAFDAWIFERVAEADLEALYRYRSAAPHVQLAAPTPDHLGPLFFALGAANKNDDLRSVYDGFRCGNVSLRSFAFTDACRRL